MTIIIPLELSKKHEEAYSRYAPIKGSEDARISPSIRRDASHVAILHLIPSQPIEIVYVPIYNSLRDDDAENILTKRYNTCLVLNCLFHHCSTI